MKGTLEVTTKQSNLNSNTEIAFLQELLMIPVSDCHSPLGAHQGPLMSITII